MSENNNHDQVQKINAKLTRQVVLPALSETLGEEFTVTIRRLVGRHIKLFEEMPDEVRELREDAPVDVALKSFPWLKKLVYASVVSPKLTEQPIGEHGDDELSLDALEADLYVVVAEILSLSDLMPAEAAASEPFRPDA